MKRLIIICEGQTEQEFCKDVLYPYFLSKEIIIHHPTIKRSAGGIVKWTDLRKQIVHHLKQEPGAHCTTFIDLYGIKKSHRFPNWEASLSELDLANRMDLLERGMGQDLPEEIRFRFIPYVQLHEFEGLLFCDYDYFTRSFEADEILDPTELAETIARHPNPELINDGPTTAPSKRLIRLVAGWDKVVYGATLASDIGLPTIREKCPRFDHWLTQLENI